MKVQASDNRGSQELELGSALAWVKRLPLWAKISLAGACLVLVAFGVFMLVREIPGPR